ncbi:MAG: bifunctional [glutamine synthetase] adenylyltransferase/[glutamine synthetase]-adenylyl-L-tyrosine phosphorylase [Ahrensia sp.]|nr:bifunctional [glutamine synthetase] adenylyltransferase/[glutamine synthetase]-adenylyl-L-tyrosine phosphorylase [Ahrensia sp.]
MSRTATLSGIKASITTSAEDARLDDPVISVSPGKKSGDLPERLKRLRDDHPRTADFLAAISSQSPHLETALTTFPDIVFECLQHPFRKVLFDTQEATWSALSSETDRNAVMSGLRHLKRKAALVIALADLGGWWSAADVGFALARVADVCVELCVRHLLADLHLRNKIALPAPNDPCLGSGFAVIAMGKHGARELNYSSDIDLVVIFDPDNGVLVDPDEGVKLFVRLTREMMRMMQERTADGYVFRTDLRLRPDPSAMPLAIPLPLALTYYEARGQNWERAAMIKARAAAGDLTTGEAFLRDLKPFIWRRYLDYAAIADIHSIKRQLQSHRGYDSIEVPGHNVKLGRGGIREIEFFVQTQQLIAGGRTEQLRGRSTLDMLDQLSALKWISAQVSDELTESYLFLRDVEHRIQMLRDEQTHDVPTQKDDQERLAALCGHTSFSAFAKVALAHLKRVHAHYGDLFSSEEDLAVSAGSLSFTGDGENPATLKTLQEIGFAEPEKVVRTIRNWHYGRIPAMQSTEAREVLTELTPHLLASIAATGKGDATFSLFEDFIEGLPAGIQLFSILNRNRHLLKLLLDLLASAPRLAELVRRRPHVFDAFLELGRRGGTPDEWELAEALHLSLGQALSVEDEFDRIRQFVAEHRFLIGLNLFGKVLTPAEAGMAYAQLAQLVLREAFERVIVHFETLHGKVEGACLAVFALGNFGEGHLTATSDLDLLVIYEFGEDNDTSDGARPLHASQYFGRLTQRFIAAMSAPTAEGVAYEIDMRLRPFGTDGPVATSLRALLRHHEGPAETWEKLALTRARFVYGDQVFGERVTQSIKEILASAKQPGMAGDVLDMRKLMNRERAAQSVWDVKLASGGLIDLEFLVQWGRLEGRVPLHMSERDALLELAGDDGTHLVEALDAYRSTIQLMRLCVGDLNEKDWPAGFVMALCEQFGAPSLREAQDRLAKQQAAVRATFNRVLGAPPEKLQSA